MKKNKNMQKNVTNKSNRNNNVSNKSNNKVTNKSNNDIGFEDDSESKSFQLDNNDEHSFELK